MTSIPPEPIYALGLFSRFTCNGKRFTWQSLLALSTLALILLPATAKAQTQPSLQWELVNPFRFIRDQPSIDELKAAYDALPTLPDGTKSAFDLERALQKRANEEVDRRRQEAKAKFNCAHTQSAEERRQCFEPYSGWFAKLAEGDHDKTCWNSDNLRLKKIGFRTDERCADYIYPKLHRIRVWITNPETLGDAAPQWLVEPALIAHDCDAKHGKLCKEFDVPYQPESPLAVRVTAQFPASTITTDAPIVVKDLLIVGLGDSFAAGEGNPDIPATFINSDREAGRHLDLLASLVAGHKPVSYPNKDDGPATWLDRRCHRSMYSYQFKTALQLALSNPQQAITYVTFSCSGAVTDQIIKDSQNSNENGDALDPQLKALRDVLAHDPVRQINYVLLSTGGNDVGFANYVAYILLRKFWRTPFSLKTGVTEKHMKEAFEKNEFEADLLGTDTKPGNYVKLVQALFGPGTRAKPNKLTIKGCALDKPCPRILLTPYPNILTDENNVDCMADRLEFNEFFGADNREPRIQTVKQSVFDQITTVQAKVPARLGWTLIDGNVELYRRRGFCARDEQSVSIGEKFQVPTWVNEGWLSFAPRDYAAYASRVRWFRLPVDSVMTTDQTSDLLGSQFHAVLKYARSNIMHPTAEGLARTADLNVEQIRKIEAKGN